MKRWQIKTTDVRTGDMLSTVEMPDLTKLGGNDALTEFGYCYESCFFPGADDGEHILRRYNTQAEAETGHAALLKKIFGDNASTLVIS